VGVGVVGAATDDGLDVFLLEHPAPVEVRFGSGEPPGPECQMVFVNITQGDHVFAAEAVEPENLS